MASQEGKNGIMQRLLRKWFGPKPLDDVQAESWERNGYLILPQFFDADVTDGVSALIDSLVSEQTRPPELARKIVIDMISGPRLGQRLRLGDVPVVDGRAKYNDLYLESDIIRACNLHPRLVPILDQLLDGAPAICNSLNFIRGSGQAAHVDTWYMPPPVADKMVVTSVCLEDVHPDAGPLFYYPGSQKIPPYQFSHGGIHAVDAEIPACLDYLHRNLAERGLDHPEAFLGRKGDVFIWAAQIVHGGSPINNQALTRKSLVTHYWRAEDARKTLAQYGFKELAKFGPDAYYIVRDHQRVAGAAH